MAKVFRKNKKNTEIKEINVFYLEHKSNIIRMNMANTFQIM